MSDEPIAEAGKQALQPIADMLRKIFGPLADEIGESLGVGLDITGTGSDLRCFKKHNAC